MELDELRLRCIEGLDAIKAEADIIDAELFLSWNEHLIARLNYTSEIPCNGVQEPKSMVAFGLGLTAVFKGSGGKVRVGFGSEVGDLSAQGLRRALTKARSSAVADPDFKSLPEKSKEAPSLGKYHDEKTMDLSDEGLVELGWDALGGALGEFKGAGHRNGLIVNGDISILKEKMAIASTRGIEECEGTTALSAAITTMIEPENVKGSGWSTATNLDDLDPAAAGREAARSAINTVGGVRIETGAYDVVLGPQATTEILSYLIAPSLNLETVNAMSSPFCGKLGEEIAVRELTLYDDGSSPGQMASKRVTCEGLPTGKTMLIDKGVLSGFLANSYYALKLSSPLKNFIPRNGFRFGGGGRSFRRRPGIFPTNIFIEGAREHERATLLAMVGKGVYIGRIWYTYPIHGLGLGDFTSTIVGDSYLIEGGKLSSPLKPNAVRVNDNFLRLLRNIIGVGMEKRPTLVWGAEEVVVASEIAVSGLRLEQIARSSN